MTPGINDLPGPSSCSHFPNSYHSMICNKMKWSTMSISTALILIIVYASSGLYTLIDVTTRMSIQSYNETILWPIYSSPKSIFLSWISLSVYFTVVLLIIILLCGIQLNKPWLLFLWSMLMIIMLLADGIVTVLSLRQHQQQTDQSSIQIKILFFVMIIRLSISLCGIFIIIFHFRQLTHAKSDYINRQRMLDRYNTESVSPSYDDAWIHSGGLLNPPKDSSNDHYTPDFPPPIPLPRAKVATIQRRPISTTFQSRNSFHPQQEYIDHPPQLPINDYHEDFRYNIPLHERFHQEKMTGVQEL